MEAMSARGGGATHKEFMSGKGDDKVSFVYDTECTVQNDNKDASLSFIQLEQKGSKQGDQTV